MAAGARRSENWFRNMKETKEPTIRRSAGRPAGLTDGRTDGRVVLDGVIRGARAWRAPRQTDEKIV